MNKNKLKSYAPVARKAFIQTVTDRAHFYGLSENETLTMEEKGDIAIIGGRPFPRKVAGLRKALEDRIGRDGFDQVMEAVAYTWFNRFMALRYMEIHGYLEHGMRVLSNANGGPIPEILEEAAQVELAGLDKQKVVELKLDGTKDSELYRMLLVAQCNALHEAMPFLFERINDETELLLPDNLLHSDSLIRKLVSEIDEEDWQEVEIIGWLYQFYISEKKDEVIGKVVKSEDIPAATQLFTPKWIVQYMVQNSLGRMWLATYPNSPLRAKMEYYIEPAEQTAEVQTQLKAITPETLNPELITFFDPASGSGHILVEAYDIFKEIYLERGYSSRDFPRLILEKNLYGLDIDDRAAQMTGFALLMKARQDDRRILQNGNAPKLNVMAIQESKDLNARDIAAALIPPRTLEGIAISSSSFRTSAARSGIQDNQKLLDAGIRRYDDLNNCSGITTQPDLTADRNEDEIVISRQNIIDLIELFQHGKTFGSLITIPVLLADKLPALSEIINDRLQNGDMFARQAAEALLTIVKQAQILSGKYDCVVTNPPYMGDGGYNAQLKEFVEADFPEGMTDLYGAFILRNLQFIVTKGLIAMITIPNWMFLQSFVQLRSHLLDKAQLDSLIFNGRGVWGSDFGSCIFTIRTFQHVATKGIFKRLFKKQGEVNSNEELKQRFFNNSEFPIYRASTLQFRMIPGSPIAFWVTDQMRRGFAAGKALSDCTQMRKGLATGENGRFLRHWHEVSQDKFGRNYSSREEASRSGRKWFPHNKGGEARKWFGNLDYVINWESDGVEIRNFRSETGRLRSRPQNLEYSFKQALTWSKITIGAFTARFCDGGCLFDDAAAIGHSMDRPQLYRILSILNSKVGLGVLQSLNPTVNLQIGDISRTPIIELGTVAEQKSLEERTQECVSIARADWDNFETSWDFRDQPLLRLGLKGASLKASWCDWEAQNTAAIRRMQEMETENNRIFIEAYGLEDELTPEVPEDQITLARADREADMKRLISYAIGCMMGRYSLDQPGLIYAHSGNVGFDQSKYKSFPADDDGIVPVMDMDWFEDDAANRFEQFLKAAWPSTSSCHAQNCGRMSLRGSETTEAISYPSDYQEIAALPSGTRNDKVLAATQLPRREGALLEENLKFVADSLSPKSGETPRETIRRYISTQFFKDHLQTYKKRPIYWLFSSGKQRAFECLVYLHRYNEATLSRMRNEYVTPLQGKLAARADFLANEIEAAATTSARNKLQKQLDTLKKKQIELAAFDDLLRHYADQRISLDLDDGVKVNYGKFGNLLAEVKAITGSNEG